MIFMLLIFTSFQVTHIFIIHSCFSQHAVLHTFKSTVYTYYALVGITALKASVNYINVVVEEVFRAFTHINK